MRNQGKIRLGRLLLSFTIIFLWKQCAGGIGYYGARCRIQKNTQNCTKPLVSVQTPSMCNITYCPVAENEYCNEMKTETSCEEGLTCDCGKCRNCTHTMCRCLRKKKERYSSRLPPWIQTSWEKWLEMERNQNNRLTPKYNIARI